MDGANGWGHEGEGWIREGGKEGEQGRKRKAGNTGERSGKAQYLERNPEEDLNSPLVDLGANEMIREEGGERDEHESKGSENKACSTNKPSARQQDPQPGSLGVARFDEICKTLTERT